MNKPTEIIYIVFLLILVALWIVWGLLWWNIGEQYSFMGGISLVGAVWILPVASLPIAVYLLLASVKDMHSKSRPQALPVIMLVSSLMTLGVIALQWGFIFI